MLVVLLAPVPILAPRLAGAAVAVVHPMPTLLRAALRFKAAPAAVLVVNTETAIKLEMAVRVAGLQVIQVVAEPLVL